MTACMSMGAYSRLSIGGTEMGFLRFQDRSIRPPVNDSDKVIDGILDPHTGNILPGIKIVAFQIDMEPGPAELAILLPLMGLVQQADPNTNVFKSDNTIATTTVVAGRVATAETYANVMLDKAVIAGQKGSSPIRVSLLFKGTTLVSADSFTAPETPLIAPAPYAFTQGVLTLAGNATAYDQFQLVIDNRIVAQHNNSINATCLASGGRVISFSCSTPYNADTKALFTVPWGDSGSNKTTGKIKFTNGTKSTECMFGDLSAIPRPPALIQKAMETRLPLNYLAARTASAPALTVTNVSA